MSAERLIEEFLDALWLEKGLSSHTRSAYRTDLLAFARRTEPSLEWVHADLATSTPFADHNGRFEATARLEDAKVRFQHDWPAVENVDASVAFIGGMKSGIGASFAAERSTSPTGSSRR